MKSVLIVDCPVRLGDLIRDKLAEDKVEVNFISGKLDSVPRMVSLLPDLAVVYIHQVEEEKDIIEYLTKVHSDVNASRTPMIAIGKPRDIHEVTDYARLGIRKYFITPFKFDTFFYCIENILQMRFIIDRTQSIFDLHVNGNTIIVEVSKAINRAKITLMTYTINEIINYLGLTQPFVVIMVSNIDLSYIDGINVEALIDGVMRANSVMARNVKLITTNEFIKELLSGHEEYKNIEVVATARDVLPALEASDVVIKGKPAAVPRKTDATSSKTDILCEKFLKNTLVNFSPAIDMRFSFDDTKSFVLPIMSKKDSTSAYIPRVAVALPDSTILDNFASSFRTKGFFVDTFNDGALFMQILRTRNSKKKSQTAKGLEPEKKYDLVIIDITMPTFNGFVSVVELTKLPDPPVIYVYTGTVPREIVVKAIHLGVSQYFVRPQTPDDIVVRAAKLFAR